MSGAGSCDACLARAWLLGRLAANLETARARIRETLELPDDELIAALGAGAAEAVRAEMAELDHAALREQSRAAGLESVCLCDPAYPAPLRELVAPPAVLHVAGGLDRLLELLDSETVAIVGARRCTEYGVDVAAALGRGLTAAGVTVLSGMALGVDAAAHAGALEVGATVAILPANPARPYPAGKRGLHRRILTAGAAVSELGPGAGVWRWMFPARNRIIAALARMTVVVEAGQRSGALVTAAIARELGREVGAVPGRVTTPQARGTNRLLAAGARVIRGPEDVLEALFGDEFPAGITHVVRAPLEPGLERLLEALGEEGDTASAIARAGLDARAGLAALAELELGGHLTRRVGGRYRVMP